MNLCGIFYAIFYLKEVPLKAEIGCGEMELMNRNSVDKTENQLQTERKVKCSDIFNTNILKEGLVVVTKKRKYNGRTVVLSLFFMSILYNGIFSGEGCVSI